MTSRPRLRALLTALVGLTPALTHGQEGRIEQARQFNLQTPTPQSNARSAEPAINTAMNLSEDESFGVQQILKRQEKLQPFRLFGEVTGFYTSNAALTRTGEIADAFLVATFGAEYRRALPYNLEFESTVKVSTYRYNDLHVLSFNSIDAGAGVTYRAPALGNLEFSARYNFTNLFGDQNGETFFTNHTITLAMQKAYAFSRAHYLYGGISALFGFSDPRIAERNEYSAYAGYHVQITKHLDADLLYRFAFYDYAEEERRDRNQALSLSARYAFNKRMSAFASAFVGRNRSNRSVFDYDVLNTGGGVGLSISF